MAGETPASRAVTRANGAGISGLLGWFGGPSQANVSTSAQSARWGTRWCARRSFSNAIELWAAFIRRQPTSSWLWGVYPIAVILRSGRVPAFLVMVVS